MFSPGNLRATFDNPNYERLLSHYIGEKYTLRYTGGMVRPPKSQLAHATSQYSPYNRSCMTASKCLKRVSTTYPLPVDGLPPVAA